MKTSSPRPVGARNRYHLSNWRFKPEMVYFLDPKRFCWPTFGLYHVKLILASQYFKIQHFGLCLLKTFWKKKRRNNLKRTFTIFIVPNA